VGHFAPSEAAIRLGAFALIFVVETAGHSLRGTEIPGTLEAEREQRQLDRAALAPEGSINREISNDL